jgi:hypothetical protein
VLFQGDFVFNSISFKPPTDFWLESVTDVEVLYVKNKYFERMWELMKKKDSQHVLCNPPPHHPHIAFLKQHALFKHFSKQTRYQIAYDLITVKTYNKYSNL